MIKNELKNTAFISAEQDAKTRAFAKPEGLKYGDLKINQQKPKTGDIFIGYNEESYGHERGFYWRFQIIAILERLNKRYYVAHKVGLKPHTGNLFLFDESGHLIDYETGYKFYLSKKDLKTTNRQMTSTKSRNFKVLND